MEYCAYYDKNTLKILDFWPSNLSNEIKEQILLFWNQEIPRKILMLLSEEDDVTTPQIKAKVGHSMSTLHENIQKLEKSGLITTKMVYIGNKKKTLQPNVLFVTKNPKTTEKLKTFLNKGFWVDSKKSNQIVEFLAANKERAFTIEEISAKTKIPVDEVRTLLDNWDSQITRAFSDFMRATPFEKKTVYKAR